MIDFRYPLGLLGLIGIPVLILIYIIKNKHTEQIVTSTYLWELSEKFLKRRRKPSIISGIVSLILQIIAIAAISFTIAQPIITLPNSAKEYCFILDGSGSMNMLSNNISRMELGKDEIEKIINESANGSKFTLVYAGENTRVVYEKLGDKVQAVELLNKLQPSGVTVSYNATLKYVQEYFNSNSSVVTYLVTDKNYNSSNIEIINVSNNEENYAIVSSNYVIEGGVLKISGTVLSYINDANLKLEVYVDDTLEETLEFSTIKLTETEFAYDSENIDFSTIRLVIKNEDGLSIDNTNIIYNVEKEHAYSTLIVSDRPFYLESVLKTVGNTSVEVVSRENYSEEYSGYSLYIFDSYSPTILPTDGTVWIFGATTSIDKAGFSYQDTIEDTTGMELTYPKNSTSTYKTLTSGMLKEKIYVSKYQKYGVYRNFTTLLTHDGNPIVFTGTAENGVREVVFAFDLHDSNFPMLIDYLILTNNLMDYSFPTIIEETSYDCGDTVKLNVLSNCESIRVESPNGNVSYLDVSTEFTEFKVTEAGTYKLNKNMSVSEIVEIFSNGNTYNPDAIVITFKEGKHMRSIASIIANNTSNTEEDVFNLLNDKYVDKIFIIGRFRYDVLTRLEFAGIDTKKLVLVDELSEVIKKVKSESLGDIYTMVCFDMTAILLNLIKEENHEDI